MQYPRKRVRRKRGNVRVIIGVWWRVCAGSMSAARSSWAARRRAGGPVGGTVGLRVAGFPVGIVGA